MAKSTNLTIIVPPLQIYHDYFTRAELDSFSVQYTAVLRPYQIETAHAASTIGTQELSWKIRIMALESVGARGGEGGGGQVAHIALLYSV